MPAPLDRPKLRPGLAAARDGREPDVVVVYDELRLSREFVRVTTHEFTWIQWLDGTVTLRDIQAAAMRTTGGGLVPIEGLLALVDRLDRALFLDSPRFEQLLTGPVREPSCIGCYPDDSEKARAQLASYFTRRGGPGVPADRSTVKKNAPLRALLAPHIDYGRGGLSYAWGYKELVEQVDARLFVIVGTAHYSGERFTLTRQDFRTPLGMARTDQDYVDRIVDAYGPGLFDDPVAHIPEHSIELEVVFLQHLFGDECPIRIVPLLTGSFHDLIHLGREPSTSPDVARMIAALRSAEEAAGEPVCYIISGDLAHIGPKFGDESPVAREQLRHSRERDDALMKCAEHVDCAGYFGVIRDEADARRICGLPPTYTALQAAAPSRGRLLHYDQYVHPRGHESVSFASMAFYQ